MYKHHEESLQIMKNYYRVQKGVIAFIFGGSVAKGMERENSDLDGMAARRNSNTGKSIIP